MEDQSNVSATGGPGTGRVRAEVIRAEGRRAAGGTPGMRAIERLDLRHPDGHSMSCAAPDPTGELATFEVLETIAGGGFAMGPGEPWMCPICLDPTASEREHVPQRALGGSAATFTCERCNNGLGSKVEVDLQHWFDHTLVGTTIEHDGPVPGYRHLSPLRYTVASDGRFGIFMDGELTDDAIRIIEAGEWSLRYRLPDERRYLLALLKHAYLAACLYLRGVPDTASVRAIRSDLIMARDRSRKDPLPVSKAARSLRVYRGARSNAGAPLALVAHVPGGGVDPEVCLSIAGAFAVSWPFDDVYPGRWYRNP
ncbi:HNH endonuclease [Nocardioides zeae]|uniref:HNH endonuclease n=1 Tax=Nocardioides imazamoxiresistens TaxID=3231893 RepID=A0ABU3PSK9_9ACTN|nr:HNH endonuclease [Nocardioides zeae]MDT9592217.1 HNH endonuclease [Nocardioides zeae]